MATYTWADAIAVTSRYVKGLPTSSIDVTTCDMVDATMWRYWFWKWTMNNLTPIAWVDGTQDYSIADSDFYRLYRVRFTRTDTTPDIIREKTLANFLSPNLEQKGTIDTIMQVAYIYEINKLRLDKAASVPSTVTVQIDGDYQKKRTKLTSTSTAVLFPEDYLSVAVEGLKWKYYQLINSPQAGELRVDKTSKEVAYTGQLGVFVAALQEMAEAEGANKGDATRFPDDGLGAARVTNPGLFAWS